MLRASMSAFYGDVPLGAGMSSSAALESCFAFALNDLYGDNKVSKWVLRSRWSGY